MTDKLLAVAIVFFIKLRDWISSHRHIGLVRLLDKHLVKVVQPTVISVLFTLVANSLISSLTKGIRPESYRKEERK